MRKKELYQKVIEYFQTAMPVAETELHYSNPFELLIAVILSAQCTDKRVNMSTPPLFKDFPTPEAFGCHHSGSCVRIHPQRELSQQQGQASGRNGTDAGTRFPKYRTRHTGGTNQTARCRT